METEIAIGLVGLVLFVYFFFKNGLAFRRCPNCERLFGFAQTGITKYQDGETFTGPLLAETTCRHCDHTEWEEITGPKSNIFPDSDWDLDHRETTEESIAPEQDDDLKMEWEHKGETIRRRGKDYYIGDEKQGYTTLNIVRAVIDDRRK